MKTYIYLASPYTAYREDDSYDEALMERRHEAVLTCFESLLSAGLVVFCPIAMTHQADCLHSGLTGERFPPSFWYEFDKPFIQYASMLFVLKLPGWKDSVGLQEEIKTAIARKIPIVYLEFHSKKIVVDK